MVLQHQDAGPFSLCAQARVSRQWQRVARSNTVWQGMQGYWPCVPQRPPCAAAPEDLSLCFRRTLAALPDGEKKILQQVWSGRQRYYDLGLQLADDLQGASPAHHLLLFCAAVSRVPSVCLHKWHGWGAHEYLTTFLLPRIRYYDLPSFWRWVIPRVQQRRAVLLAYLRRMPPAEGVPRSLGPWQGDATVAAAYLRAGGDVDVLDETLQGDAMLLALLQGQRDDPGGIDRWLRLLGGAQRDDAALLLPLLRRNPPSLQEASLRLRNTPEFVLPLLEQDGEVLRIAGEAVRDDYNCAKVAVSNCREAWFFLSPRLQKDASLFAFVHPFSKKERALGHLANT